MAQPAPARPLVERAQPALSCACFPPLGALSFVPRCPLSAAVHGRKRTGLEDENRASLLCSCSSLPAAQSLLKVGPNVTPGADLPARKRDLGLGALFSAEGHLKPNSHGLRFKERVAERADAWRRSSRLRGGTSLSATWEENRPRGPGALQCHCAGRGVRGVVGWDWPGAPVAGLGGETSPSLAPHPLPPYRVVGRRVGLELHEQPRCGVRQ